MFVFELSKPHHIVVTDDEARYPKVVGRPATTGVPVEFCGLKNNGTDFNYIYWFEASELGSMTGAKFIEFIELIEKQGFSITVIRAGWEYHSLETLFEETQTPMYRLVEVTDGVQRYTKLVEG